MVAQRTYFSSSFVSVNSKAMEVKGYVFQNSSPRIHVCTLHTTVAVLEAIMYTAHYSSCASDHHVHCTLQ